MLPSATILRYATPLREGGSLPGIVEADDLGTYVAKFTGAGQGAAALVAEVVVGELARRLGLRMPELVTLELDDAIGRLEPDPEIQHLLVSSAGSNLGIDFLPGSVGFEPTVFPVDPSEADLVMWLDAFTLNVDRTWRNPNLLVWHGNLWLIDHGAALVWQHGWARAGASTVDAGRVTAAAVSTASGRRLDLSDHVLAGTGSDLDAASRRATATLDRAAIEASVAMVPDEWLAAAADSIDTEAARDAHVRVLVERLGDDAWLDRRPQSTPTRTTARRGPSAARAEFER